MRIFISKKLLAGALFKGNHIQLELLDDVFLWNRLTLWISSKNNYPGSAGGHIGFAV